MKKIGGKGRVKKDDKEQSQRFVETARSLDADKSGRSFHKAFNAFAGKDQKNKSC